MANKSFGILKESLYASDHTKFKKTKKCNTSLNVNNANLINNLYTKENLEGVNVIELTNPNLPVCPCKPIYEQYNINGNTICNINNYTEYSLQKETVKSSSYGYNGPWPHFGGLYNNNIRLSTYIGSQTGNLAWTFTSGSGQQITSTPVIDSSGNIYFSYYSGNTSTFMSVNSIGQTNWKIQNITGISISSPMIDVNSNVYFCTADLISIIGSIYLFSKTGIQKWRYDIDEQIYSSPSLDSRGNIYFGSADTENNIGFFYSINLQGVLNWKIDGCYCNSNTHRRCYMKQVYTSPTLDNFGNIYFGTADIEYNVGSLYSINTCGKINWRHDISGQIYSSPAIDSSNNIYFGTANDPISYLYSLNVNGDYNWTYSVTGQIFSSPAIDSLNRVYFGTADGSKGTLYCIEANSTNDVGLLVWYNDPIQIYSSPSIDSLGNVYFSDLTTLYALSSSNVLLWSSVIGTNTLNSTVFTSSPSIGYDGTVFVGSNNGNLYAYNNTDPIIIPGGYQVGSPWPHFGGLNNFNTRRSIYSGDSSGNNYTKYGPGKGTITSSPVIDVSGNVYYCVVDSSGFIISSILYKNNDLIYEFANQLILSTPIINYEGNIYICSCNIDGTGVLYNINPNTHVVIQEHRFINNIIYASPSLDSCGNIYIGTINQSTSIQSYLYSISAYGNINWSYDYHTFSFSSPAIDSSGNTYFIGMNPLAGISLYSIGSDGSFNSNFNGGNTYDCSFGSYSSVSIDSNRNIYYVTSDMSNHNSYLYSVTSNGSFNSNFNNGVPFKVSNGTCQSSTALDSNENIYFSTVDERGNSTLFSITSDGLYNTNFGPGYIFINSTDTSQSSPTIDSYNNIYLNSVNALSQNIIYSYNSSGIELWNSTTTSRSNKISISSPSIGFDGTTYVGGIDGTLYKFSN